MHCTKQNFTTASPTATTYYYLSIYVVQSRILLGWDLGATTKTRVFLADFTNWHNFVTPSLSLPVSLSLSMDEQFHMELSYY